MNDIRRNEQKKIGEILLEARKITEENIEQILEEQKRYGERFGEVVVKLGLLSEKELIETVSRQQGIPIISLDGLNVPAEILNILTSDDAKKFMAIPIGRRFNVLQLAMVDPLNIGAIDEISKMVRLEVSPCIVTEGEMKRALERFYSIKTIVEETLERIGGEARDTLTFQRDNDQTDDVRISIDMIEQEPVIKFVNSLLMQAISDGASDIHIEPLEKRMRIRMRLDGKLREFPSPERKMFLPIVSRVKILGGMDIAKTRIAQDGRFNVREGSKEVGVRVSTFPTIYGEKVVMRLLDKSAGIYGIDKLGLLNEDESKLKEVLKIPYGFILSTGPTGSGKSTTLYAILRHLNAIEKNIITIEDPVEYTLEGLAQSQVNPKAGLNFDSGLRSILRQDPDIIMVGEIRDRETATISIHSALTGHIVLSTLHTNDAAGAVTRLVEMGVEPFLVTSSVTCVIAQRLIRKICIECKEAYEPQRAVYESIGLEEGIPLHRGRGCQSCRNTGYKGRTAVFEILVMDDRIRELVVRREPSEFIKRQAVFNGMRLMYEDAIQKVILGITTLEEAVAVTRVML